MARYVRVTSISYAGVRSGEDRKGKALEGALTLIDQAATDRPDVLCLPETFTGLGCGTEEWIGTAEPVPGPTTEALGAKAREHNAYIICPMVEARDGRRYNAAVVLDRRGQVAGIYHKIHPTISEIEAGITPGVEAATFETDFGRIGCAICYDLNFRDVIEGLSADGAEIVFFPSMYRGGLQLSLWAFDFGCWVVSATPGENSAIVNPLGQVLVQSFHYAPIISRRINLDCAVLHIDYNYAKFDAIKRACGEQVQMEVIAPEAVFLLTCDDTKRSVGEIIAEFELETRSDYFHRANRVREEALNQARTVEPMAAG